jgi:acyl-CoA thioesterase-1
MKVWVPLAILLAVAAGCGRSEVARDESANAPAGPAAPAAPAHEAVRAKVVCLGDSLTIGLGLPIEQSYPSLLQRRLDADGLKYEVVNAGVSGDTSAGGLSRLDWALQGDVRILIVALGGNDGLRGLPPEALKQNLAEIIERAQTRGVRVILAGMEAPPNYGPQYLVSFHKVYPALASQYHVPLVPFLLQGVAGVDGLNQPDGIHPTAEGARLVADNVWTVLKPIAESEARSGS